MSRPGFYNDNEYRAYPFIYAVNSTLLPNSAVVDAGIIMGLDSGFDAATHAVWLSAVRRAGDTFTFEFSTNAPGASATKLTFTRQLSSAPWEIEFAESAEPFGPDGCDMAPIWEGFLVTGPLTDLAASLSSGQSLEFSTPQWQLEPGVIQSLVKGYVRSLNVGNMERRKALEPDGCQGGSSSSSGTAARQVVVYSRSVAGSDDPVYARCIQGPIVFKEGYNCRIRQTARTNELRVIADAGAGEPADQALCKNGGELAFRADELPPTGSPFLSGGPACDEIISTINGISGENVNLIGGTGVAITADGTNNKIVIALKRSNLVGACAQ